MASDELKIVLEDVKQKFDTVEEKQRGQPLTGCCPKEPCRRR